jgi:hypothetical protein
MEVWWLNVEPNVGVEKLPWACNPSPAPCDETDSADVEDEYDGLKSRWEEET